ncbi:unnamed protein product [marine sediment metagenome]|uniref:Uncharacterized protein n=1 Tax=marine sediment metagenome TaxID=412755 RepID=X1K0F5_9ZZZZ
MMQERTAVLEGPGAIEEIPPSPLEKVAEPEEGELSGVPVLKINRYSGGDQSWVELVRWDIPEGHQGDLHQIVVRMDDVSKTRLRLVIGDVDQKIPTDRDMYSPLELSWRRNRVPGRTTVYVEVLSIDGTAIVVHGLLLGAVKWIDIENK